jgi:hypothetical protein
MRDRIHKANRKNDTCRRVNTNPFEPVKERSAVISVNTSAFDTLSPG